jgi:predicted acyltransferase
MQYNKLSTQRILSIDALRGITILVMVFVNELAGAGNIPAWMKHMHADDDAMSFVDAVFPFFLFVVGMSIPFAINSRLAKGDSFLRLQQHILFRTLGLLVLGFFMVNAEGGYNEQAMGISINLWALLFLAAVILIWKVYYKTSKTLVLILKIIGFLGLIILAAIYRDDKGGYISPRWWGILGLIGWAYLYSCIFYQLFKGNKYWLCGALAFCVAWYAAGKLPFMQQTGWLHFIPAQSGNAAHTSIVLCGILASLIFFDETNPLTTQKRFLEAFGFAAMLFIAGYLLRPYYKISKIHATPTWCLYSAGFGTIVFAFLYWLIDIKQVKRWTAFFKPAASNPLLTYIIPDIIYYLTSLFGISLISDSLDQGLTGIAWSAFFAVAVMGIAALLNKLKVRLKL